MAEMCGKLQSKAVGLEKIPACQQGAACVDHRGTRPALSHPHLGGTLPGRNSPQLHCGKAHRGLGKHLSSPPHTHTCIHRHTPSKSESWRLHVPSFLCSLHLHHLSLAPCRIRMFTSGKLAAGGRKAGRGCVCCWTPGGDMEGTSGIGQAARPFSSQINK